jgi:hypothetical protein
MRLGCKGILYDETFAALTMRKYFSGFFFKGVADTLALIDGDSISLTNVCRTLIRLHRLGYSLRRVCACLVGVGVGILRIWRI